MDLSQRSAAEVDLRRGLDLEVAGAALAMIAVAAPPGNPIAGLLVDRFGSRATLVFGLLVTAAWPVWLVSLQGLPPIRLISSSLVMP